MKTTGGDFFGRHYFREEDGIHKRGLKDFAFFNSIHMKEGERN